MTTDAAALGPRTSPGWRIDLNPQVAKVAGSVGARLTIGALAVLIAFHFSLLTLVRDLGLDTPLAYLGLVPFISVGIALALPKATGPGIHDRQLDHIVGLPLAAAAVIAIRVLPQRLSTVYWDDRLDLLTLPVFVFAISVLLFGLRTTWRYRVPVFFLFMAWPLPYALAIEHAIDFSTSTTINALTWVLHYVPVATQDKGPDNALFHVGTGAKGFPVEIASACAGVNSMVGFVLVGTAFLAVVGRKLTPGAGGDAAHRSAFGRKLAWLGIGLSLVWALNIVRLVLVLWTGKAFGETAALDGLHPFIGIVIFAAAIVGLLMAMPIFGLQAFPGMTKTARPVITGSRRERVAANLSRPIAATGAWRLAAVATIAATILVGVTDSTFSHFQLTASDFGTPKLLGFDAANPLPVGYVGERTASYDWVKRYFGGDSTWHRYTYSGLGSTAAVATGATGSIVADVIDASKISPFNAYGIEACYAFHGYSYSTQKSMNLGAGVVGYSLAYRAQDNVTWSVLYWIWAVDDAQGNKRYERVVLLKPSSIQASPDASPNANPLKGVGYDSSGNAAVASSAQDQDQLMHFAQTVIAHQPAAKHKLNSA